MKKNKKVLGIVLCMAMAVTALAGCGAADTSAKKSDDTKAARPRTEARQQTAERN